MSEAETSELRRANDNRWYCLATLYGEPTKRDRLNSALSTKNRLAWNRWFAERLSDQERANLIKNGFRESELIPFAPAEKDAFCSAFTLRTGRKEEAPPDPAEIVDFSRTNFDRVVSFAGFQFAVGVNFMSATFSRHVDFSSAAFLSYANFVSAAFSMYAAFNSATFFHYTDFESATFLESCEFDSARFCGDADFDLAKFPGYASFNETIFLRYATFKSATFSKDAGFKSATFAKNADFINAKFSANTAFAGARFETYVPDFRGAEMHEATEWHGVRWPSAPQDKDSAQAQVYAYERLKQEMERLKKHEDEQSFFRKELRARRGLVSPWSSAWFLNYVYEVLSNYGQSILRPTLWLLAVFTIGWAAFAVFPVFNGMRMTILAAASLSFANVFSFLPLKREIMTPQMVEGLSNAAQILGVVQSLLGIVLLFLLGLALRSRFRMR